MTDEVMPDATPPKPWPGDDSDREAILADAFRELVTDETDLSSIDADDLEDLVSDGLHRLDAIQVGQLLAELTGATSRYAAHARQRRYAHEVFRIIAKYSRLAVRVYTGIPT